ncbi:glutathione S-transferase family protein [Orrella sp. 11846]|uniref:glutathione S-transferase family protein n=1 Tax=Orrella sp. 11846 TaxID=3409913 RepID=UPI003B59B923
MILIGRYLSPFVRRVGTSLRWVELNYEHRSLSPSRDTSAILKINPMGKVPILILDDGEQLIESSAILDTVLATVPGQTLLPGTGAARKRILQHTSIVTSALDKAIIGMYEKTRRPEEMIYQPYLDEVLGQACAGFDQINNLIADSKLGGITSPTLADLTASVGYTFMHLVLPDLVNTETHPALAALAAEFEKTQAFLDCPIKG